jgi:hypothetical protein
MKKDLLNNWALANITFIGKCEKSHGPPDVTKYNWNALKNNMKEYSPLPQRQHGVCDKYRICHHRHIVEGSMVAPGEECCVEIDGPDHEQPHQRSDPLVKTFVDFPDRDDYHAYDCKARGHGQDYVGSQFLFNALKKKASFLCK